MPDPDWVLYQVIDKVAVLTLNNPPVNAFSPWVLDALSQRLSEASQDASAKAIVLIGGGKTFTAGADINEFIKIASGEKPLDDQLHRVIFACEDSLKPVIAAMHGTALGGGMEIAMGCHYRIADSRVRLGLPEVKLGLIPGAMGTQRLPRLCGVAKAAELCATGRMFGAQEALEAGIIDRIATEDLTSAAVAFASEIISAGQTPRKTRELTDRLGQPDDYRDKLAELTKSITQSARGQIAPLKAIEAVALSATHPFDEGVQRESEIFKELITGDQSRGCIHIFFGERSVAKVPGISSGLHCPPIEQAAIVGAGTMGSGIAMTYAVAGIPVVLKEVNQEQLDKGMDYIRQQAAAAVKRGRMSEAQARECVARVTPTLDDQALANADVIVEAVFEGLKLKQQVMAQLDQIAKPSAILATNTSTLDIDQIAAATQHPERVIGHHFFSPANVMRLLEVVRGKATNDEVIASSMALAKRLGKVGVLVGNCFGFVGNRMFWPYQREAQFLLEEGATVEHVDRVLYDFGMAMGPHAVMDLAGIDVGWRIDQERQAALPDGLRQPLISSQLYHMNRYGQKTSAGWYRYEGRQAIPDPVVQQLIEQTSRDAGLQRRRIADQEIIERTLYAMINEGAKILQEKIALRSVDIDVIYVFGYGFPAWRGGPMMYADTIGLQQVYDRVCHYHQLHGAWWEPADLLRDLATSGKRFTDIGQTIG